MEFLLAESGNDKGDFVILLNGELIGVESTFYEAHAFAQGTGSVIRRPPRTALFIKNLVVSSGLYALPAQLDKITDAFKRGQVKGVEINASV